MIYKDQQSRIQTRIFHKPTYQKTYLHAQWNHPKRLKDIIPYCQALRIKAICSNTSEFIKKSNIITKFSTKERVPK